MSDVLRRMMSGTYALEIAIATFRARQRDALSEWAICTDPDLARYLRARADQAGCESAAMEASVAQWRKTSDKH